MALCPPEKTVKIFVDPATELTQAQGEEAGQGCRHAADSVAQFVDIVPEALQVLRRRQGLAGRINPLNRDSKNASSPWTRGFNFDASALFRHPEIVALRDADEEGRSAEIRSLKFDLAYISLDGIVCLVSSAGLAMAAMDAIKLFGGEPATLDVGGGALAVTGPSRSC